MKAQLKEQVEIIIDEEQPELSVPVMMDMLDRIHNDALRDECLEEFADAIDQAMCVLAEMQRQAFEVMEEIEAEKKLFGERYVSLPHKVC